MGEIKWHKGCGGKVVYREALPGNHFEFAGFCLKCEAYPLYEEDIIFEKSHNRVERFYSNKETQGWIIVSKREIPEVLDT